MSVESQPTTDHVAEAANRFLETLTEEGYSLEDKVAVSKAIRRNLRAETESEQKKLQQLIDSL